MRHLLIRLTGRLPAEWSVECLARLCEERVAQVAHARGEGCMPVRIGVAGGIAASSLPEALALAGQDSVAGRVAATLARLAAATWTANRVCRDDAAWLVIRR